MTRLSPFRPFSYSSPLRAASLLTMATVLSACGGGSGGGSDSGSGPSVSSGTGDDFVELSSSDRILFAAEPSEALIRLSAENAEQVAAAVLHSVARAGRLGNEDGAIGPLNDLLVDSGVLDFDFSSFAEGEFDDFLQHDAQGLADGFNEINCPVSGQFILDLDVPDSEADVDAFSADLDFLACDTGLFLLDGGLNLVGDGLLYALESGLDALERAELRISADDFEVHLSPDGARLDGSALVTVTPVEGGVSLVVAMDLVCAGPVQAISWGDFELRTSRDDATGGYSFSTEGTLGINHPGIIDGQVVVSTQLEFVGAADLTPASGSVLITGAGDSRLTVAAVAGGDIEIELDEGYGDAPLVFRSSWEELEALLAELVAAR